MGLPCTWALDQIDVLKWLAVKYRPQAQEALRNAPAAMAQLIDAKLREGKLF